MCTCFNCLTKCHSVLCTVDEGQLCDADGNRFQYAIYDSKADNTLRYEGIALVMYTTKDSVK